MRNEPAVLHRFGIGADLWIRRAFRNRLELIFVMVLVLAFQCAAQVPSDQTSGVVELPAERFRSGPMPHFEPPIERTGSGPQYSAKFVPEDIRGDVSRTRSVEVQGIDDPSVKLKSARPDHRLLIVESTPALAAEDVLPPSQARSGNKFNWKLAISQSLLFLAWQHSLRMLQPRTRDFLDGPFFKDWKNSVKNLRGWADGDVWYVNYIAHPMQGAVTGRFYLNNSEAARTLAFENTSRYWKIQLKNLAWQAFWSTQYEIGPISEANIGNVGLRTFDSHKMTYLDLVITPVAGVAWSVGEDMIDKYFLKEWLETNYKNRIVRRILRSFMTPSISFANLFRFRAPWFRNDRKL